MNNCKKLLPNYFKILSNSNLSKKTININKHLIIVFLKEYSTRNNNKYNRNRFNIEFFNKFFNEILPQNHPEFVQIPIKELQSNIRNFFNYLTLKNVINKEITQKLARNLDNEIILNRKVNKTNKNKNRYQDESEVYSDKKLNLILKKSNRWAEEFVNSNFSNSLSVEEKEQSEFIIECFFEYLYSYFLKTPEQVDEDDVKEICLYLLPRKLPEGKDFFKIIVPVLLNFFVFLEKKSIISNANVLCTKLNKLRNKIIKAAANPENWGMAKSLFMKAQKAGVDLKNETKHYMDYADWWSTDKVEALKTKEIINKLRDFGIPFEKEQFLTNVHQVYSAFDITREWRAKYTITAEEKDEDFIWYAASILWKRLAPEVINSEKLNEMMQEGYELIAENNYIEGCTLWLRVWGYLKERFQPEMKSIYAAEQVFSGLQSLYNWCGDLAMELYAAGVEKNVFFRKRIEYCQEFLEFFPESNDEYIQHIIRSLAESYFELDLVDKGEKIFFNMIKKFPEYTDGYICWGDQYSGFWNRQRYDYKKALTIYNMGLEKVFDLREVLKERIQSLEEKQEGLQFKENLLSNYESFLSKKNLSQKLLKKKIEHGANFLDFLIFSCNLNDFEILAEEFGSEDILKYLGYWSIQQKKISSKTAIIELIRHVKSYIYYLFDYLFLPDQEIKEIKRILNSKDFFIRRLKVFQKIDDNMVKSEKKFQKLRIWRDNYTGWYSWDEHRKLEEERISKKVTLSKDKRKLFKDIDYYNKKD
ncbi:MAG: hypothetical protein ACTSUT_16240 [Promethearchaeota archaeon]